MQLRAGQGAILAGSKDQQKSFGGQIHAGKPPLGQLSGIVGQRPVEEIYRGAAAVIDLDPIGRIAILVQQGLSVAGHEFGDDDLGIPAGRPADKQQAG